MKAVLQFLKQAGATVIVLFLVAMMAVTFSSQPIDEILTVLTGGSKIGSFDGQEISDESYAYADDACRNQFRQFPNIPDMFLAQCIESRLKELYVLPSIAEKMGKNVTKEQVEQQLIEQAKLEYEQQALTTLEEDRLSLKQLYQQQVRMLPLSLRVRLASAQQAADTLYSDFTVPDSYADSLMKAESVALNLALIRYSEVDLLSKIDDRVDPLLTGKERTEAKQKMLSEIKDNLGKLKGDQLTTDKVSNQTGIKPVQLNNVRLASLSAVQLPGGTTANLASADFLLSIDGAGTYGPFQDGQNTFYIEIKGIQKLPAAAEKEQSQQKYSLDILRSFSEYIVNQEAKRGDFKTVVSRQAPAEIPAE